MKDDLDDDEIEFDIGILKIFSINQMIFIVTFIIFCILFLVIDANIFNHYFLRQIII